MKLSSRLALLGSLYFSTDYTVQASAVVIATGVASAIAGFSAQALGYVTHFALAAASAAAALLVVRAAFPTLAIERSLRRERSLSDIDAGGGDADREVAPCA